MFHYTAPRYEELLQNTKDAMTARQFTAYHDAMFDSDTEDEGNNSEEYEDLLDHLRYTFTVNHA